MPLPLSKSPLFTCRIAGFFSSSTNAHESHLRPGGWLEFGDIWAYPHYDNDALPHDSVLNRFFTIFHAHFRRQYGWHPLHPDDVPAAVAAAGFINVRVRREKLPLGPWCRQKGDNKMREVGLYMQLLVDGLVAGVLAKYKELDLTKEEATAWALEAEKAVRDPGQCAYLWWTSVWAQKPGSE